MAPRRQETEHLGQLALPSNERGPGRWDVDDRRGRAGRREVGRELGVADLEELDWAGQVLEAVDAKGEEGHALRECLAHEVAHGRRDQDLAAVGRVGDAGRLVDRHPHHVVVGPAHLAGMHAHADTQLHPLRPLVGAEGELRLDGGGHGVPSRGEDDEEPVAGGRVLVPAVGSHRRANHAGVAEPAPAAREAIAA